MLEPYIVLLLWFGITLYTAILLVYVRAAYNRVEDVLNVCCAIAEVLLGDSDEDKETNS